MKLILMIVMLSFLAHATQFQRNDATNTVIDFKNALEWQDDLVISGKTWLEAIDYCQTLSLASYSDWYLPNINELKSLINRKVSDAVFEGFRNVATGETWSSTTSSSITTSAWYVTFSSGSVQKVTAKTSTSAVRCVRAY